ncbi:MAG TPA: phosphoglucosamine mutase [Limnochordales bacterium]|nr:phosphoglucosamine mutase [Limnochordales bacterium]
MGWLFGTDGVRGVANDGLTPELAFRLGRCAAAVLAGESVGPEGGRPVIVGRDTRRSGDLLEAALAAGVASAGLDVLRVGVVPTPGVAYLTRTQGAAFGVMISASHNPAEDNGIKFFSADGYKLPDALEARIEALVGPGPDRVNFSPADGLPRPVAAGVGRILSGEDRAEAYSHFLAETAGVSLDGLRVVVDCAHGAAYRLAPAVLRRLGAEVITLCDAPDGMNINVGCGSTSPEQMQAAVRRHGADAGIAYDGDGDRVIMADERGGLVDGDAILAICGRHLAAQGRLRNRAVAATVYSNLGLKRALQAAGVEVVETPPGDRCVLEAMLERDLVLGGEQSGHVIFLEYNTTGDGLLTALQVLRIMRETGQSLGQLAGQMSRVPQILIKVAVRDKRAFHHNVRVQEVIREVQEELGADGRLLVRPSGTEPVIRIMGEGMDNARIQAAVDRIAAVVAAELG